MGCDDGDGVGGDGGDGDNGSGGDCGVCSSSAGDDYGGDCDGVDVIVM